MEYNLNINQRAVYELGLQDKLDAIDLLLFDFVYHLMNKPTSSKMTVNGKEYVMIRHNLIAQECPILGINHRDTFRKRMLKLVDAGLLNRCDSNQETGNSLYSRGDKFSVFVFSDQKFVTLPTEIGTPADNDRDKHNSIEHNIPPTTLFDNKDSIPQGGRRRFIKPTVEEVASYCTERNNGIDAQEFIDFYESKGWVIGKSPMKDWKAAVRTWENKERKQNAPKPKSNVVVV